MSSQVDKSPPPSPTSELSDSSSESTVAPLEELLALIRAVVDKSNAMTPQRAALNAADYLAKISKMAQVTYVHPEDALYDMLLNVQQGLDDDDEDALERVETAVGELQDVIEMMPESMNPDTIAAKRARTA